MLWGHRVGIFSLSCPLSFAPALNWMLSIILSSPLHILIFISFFLMFFFLCISGHPSRKSGPQALDVHFIYMYRGLPSSYYTLSFYHNGVVSTFIIVVVFVSGYFQHDTHKCFHSGFRYFGFCCCCCILLCLQLNCPLKFYLPAFLLVAWMPVLLAGVFLWHSNCVYKSEVPLKMTPNKK